MRMLEECIDRIFEKSILADSEEDRELYKSIYHNLLDYKDILNKTIELTNEVAEISNRWELVKKANEINTINEINKEA